MWLWRCGTSHAPSTGCNFTLKACPRSMGFVFSKTFGTLLLCGGVMPQRMPRRSASRGAWTTAHGSVRVVVGAHTNRRTTRPNLLRNLRSFHDGHVLCPPAGVFVSGAVQCGKVSLGAGTQRQFSDPAFMASLCRGGWIARRDLVAAGAERRKVWGKIMTLCSACRLDFPLWGVAVGLGASSSSSFWSLRRARSRA